MILCHLRRVPQCHLRDAVHVLPQRSGVLVDVKREHLGVGQSEDEAAPHLGDCAESLEGRVVELLHDFEGLIHAVIDWIAAVELCFLNVCTHTQTHIHIVAEAKSVL